MKGPRQLPDRTNRLTARNAVTGRPLLPLLAGCFVFAWIAVPHDARGAEEKKDGSLESVERALKESEARSEALTREAHRIAEEKAKIRRALIRAALDTQIRQRAIARLEFHITGLRREERIKARALKKRHKDLSQLLAALQRIARHPPEAVMAYSATPQDTLRSAILLGSAIPELESRAKKLKTALASLGRLREQAREHESVLAKQVDALKEKRKQLAQLFVRKRDLERVTLAKRNRFKRETRQLAAKAQSLRDLLDRLEQRRKAQRTARLRLPAPGQRRPGTAKKPRETGPDLPPLTTRARGRFAPPVLGAVTTRFGAKNRFGGRAKGLRIATTPNAQVVAPYDGLVVFAGLFRGYGRLLIIDHGGGYHSLLAGLDRIDADVNQQLLTGEPVGVMPPTAKDKLGLYLELRKNGRPINPLPWLAAPPTDKVSG